MKFGINTFLFESPFTDEGTKHFKAFREIGFDGVEIGLENKGDIDYNKVLGGLKDNGLCCCSICGALGADRDLRGTEEQQETSKQYLKDCIDACDALECDLLVGPFGSEVGRTNMETETARREQWKAVVGNMQDICAYAEKKGVYLAYEPINRFETDFLNICADAKRMVKDVGSPMLKIHLDTFHMNIEEKSLPMALLDAGDLLYHVHASESDRGTPGSGTVDWKGVRDALKRLNYNRYVVIESFTPDVEIIARAAAIWRYTEKTGLDLARKGLNFLNALFG